MAVTQSLTLTQVGQSTEENYSKVRIFWRSTQTGQSYNAVERTAKYYVSVNGGMESEYSVKYTLPKGATQTIVDATIKVQHDDKGNATIKVRTWMDTHISASVVEMGKSLDLTPIPRASTIGASDAFIEANTTIVVARRNADFRHSISYAFGDLAGYITPDGSIADTEIIFDAPSVSWAIPFSFYKQIPDTPSGVCTLRCTTYSGNKVVGEPQTAQFRITANPASCSPGAAGNVVDMNPKTVALTGNASKMVRFVSTAKCTVKGTLAWGGADVKKVEINGVYVGDNAGVELTIEKIETDSIEIRVTDARGYTGSERLEFEMIPYVRLTNHATVTRVDPGTGASVLTVEGSYYNNSFGAKSNTLTIQYSVDDGDLETVEAILNGNTYTAEVEIHGLDYRTGHTMEVIVSDELETVAKTVEIGASIPLYYYGKDFFRFNVPVELAAGLAAGFDYSFAGTAAELSDYLKQHAAAGFHTVILSGSYEVAAKIPIPAGMTIIGGKFVATEDFADAMFSALGDGVRLIGVTMAAPAHNKTPSIYVENKASTTAKASNVMGIYSNGYEGIALINCVCDKIIPAKINDGSGLIQGCRITDAPMFVWGTNCRMEAVGNEVSICDTGLDKYYHIYYVDKDSELIAISNHIRCDVATPYPDVVHLMTAGNTGTYRARGVIQGDVICGNFGCIIDSHYADISLEGCRIANSNHGAWTEFSNMAHSAFRHKNCTLDYSGATLQTYDVASEVTYDGCQITKDAPLNRRGTYNACRIMQTLDSVGILSNWADVYNCEFHISGSPTGVAISASADFVFDFIGNVVDFETPNSNSYLFRCTTYDGGIYNNVFNGAATTVLWHTNRGASNNNIVNGAVV